MKLSALGSICILFALTLANAAQGQDFNHPRHLYTPLEKIIWYGSKCWNVSERCVAGNWGDGNEFLITNHCPARVYVRLCFQLVDGRDSCEVFGVDKLKSVGRSSEYDVEQVQWYYVGSAEGGMPEKLMDFPLYDVNLVGIEQYAAVLLVSGKSNEYVAAHIAHITGNDRDKFCAHLTFDDWNQPMNWE